jgi:hypothetical protein
MWEPSLLAKNDNAVCLTDSAALIAGKPRSHRSDLNIGATTWDRLQPGKDQYIHTLFIV